MNEENIQKKLIDDIFQACDNNNLSQLKSLMGAINLKSSYHQKNQTARQIFKKACFSGSVEIIDELISLALFEKSKKPIFLEALKDLIDNHQPKDYPVISYLINEPKLQEKRDENFYFIFDEGLRQASLDDDLPFFKSIVDLDKPKPNQNHPYLFSIHYLFLHTNVCYGSNINVFKYLYAYRQLTSTDKRDEEYGFSEACHYKNMNILNFLIFEQKIEKTEDVEESIKLYKCEEATKLFNIRDLNEQLNGELPSKEISVKQNKI